MSYELEFTEIALSDISKHKKAGDRAVLKKLQKILLELKEHPTKGIGQPEILKYGLSGLYSRRINSKHRLVYSIDDEIVVVHVLSAWAHYGDK
jgi:toxin YoeB